MKRIMLLLILTIFCTFAFAQNKKGYWLVGTGIGSTGYSTGGSENTNSSSSSVFKTDNNSFYFSVNPYAGKYVSDNVVVGAGVTLAPYTSKTTASNYENKYSYFYIGIGPFARFYLNNTNPKGAPFVQINTGLNFYPGYKSTYTPTSGIGYTSKYDSYTSWNAGAQLGYEHFLNSVIGLFYTLGYSYYHTNSTYLTTYTNATTYSSTNKTHSSNINFEIGLNVHLPSLKGKK